ncbi:transcriptional activator DEMETER [Abeliophyllum distichum]|uniref:Transcriptional activator DEMETER n=1 Tax=Abeliophyllum distichum TaxID=126358 RepID=A0ABD1VU16_9LAMI
MGFYAASKTSEVKEGHRKEYSVEQPETENLYCSIRSVNQILPQVSLPLASAVPPTTAKDHTLNVIARILNMRNAKTNQRRSQNGYNQVNQCISGGVAQLVIQANATKAKLDRRRQLMPRSRSQLLEDLVDITEERGSKREYSDTQADKSWNCQDGLSTIVP